MKNSMMSPFGPLLFIHHFSFIILH